MAPLSTEIAKYEEMRVDLEASHSGQWIVIHGRTVVGIYEDFQDAAHEAVLRYGRGPYLIQQIDEPPFVLPASVVYTPVRTFDAG